MRIFAVILGLAVVLLQYRLWMSDYGVREVNRLKAAIDTQAGANRELRERNRQLAAEVDNLKVGFSAIEERARSELGMVGRTETFFQVVRSPPAIVPPRPMPATGPAARPLTARSQ